MSSPVLSDSTWLPDARIAGTQYRVRYLLGSGGMGTVYAVRHLDGGAELALKVLSSRLAQRHDLGERLLREARVLAQLRGHPHLVEILDSGELADGRPFYVMELLEGSALRRLIRGPMPYGRACAIVLQLLSALAAVHASGIVHRDVKPDNVFVQADGLCKLLDFGVVKAIVDGAFPNDFLTGPGALIGTTRYIAPEYVGKQTPDARADIYAAGVVLYELLLGAPPLADVAEGDFLGVVSGSGVPPLDDGNAFHVPGEIRRVVARATARDRDVRYPSAEAFAADLAWSLVRLGVALPAAARAIALAEARALAPSMGPPGPLPLTADDLSFPRPFAVERITAPLCFDTITRPPPAKSNHGAHAFAAFHPVLDDEPATPTSTTPPPLPRPLPAPSRATSPVRLTAPPTIKNLPSPTARDGAARIRGFAGAYAKLRVAGVAAAAGLLITGAVSLHRRHRSVWPASHNAGELTDRTPSIDVSIASANAPALDAPPSAPPHLEATPEASDAVPLPNAPSRSDELFGQPPHLVEPPLAEPAVPRVQEAMRPRPATPSAPHGVSLQSSPKVIRAPVAKPSAKPTATAAFRPVRSGI